MAEQTLTKDGASVTVDAIMYWRIVDAGRAAIQVVNFTQAVMGAAQGGLRDIIGRNDLSTVLSQRRELDEQLTLILDEQTEPWGIKVQSVQLRDIKVPDNLQDALSRMAQAERERQARVILGESEVQVAEQFAEAGELYRHHPTALHLRGMNMLYETMRSGLSTVIVVPSSALESMNLGAIGGISALGQTCPAARRREAAPPPRRPIRSRLRRRSHDRSASARRSSRAFTRESWRTSGALDPGQLGHFGARPKLGQRVQQLGVHQQDHGEAGAFDGARRARRARAGRSLREARARARSRWRLVAFEPAAGQRPRLVVAVGAVDQQDASAIVADERRHAHAVPAVAQPQVEPA